ncbi:MAG: hypothetical protein R3236_10945, partial [Phycisphaeraceae bacterium]|nr:hypothetical protein [Phycisphaeraceae bacterium]
SAREHRHWAADYYLEHSRLVSFENETLAGESLWRAATLYEKAADIQIAEAVSNAALEKKVAVDRASAIEAYTEHFRNRPNDPKRAESMHRLGMLYLQTGNHLMDQARRHDLLAQRDPSGEAEVHRTRAREARTQAHAYFRDAVETFGQLNAQKPRSPFAIASQVPWALAYLKMGPSFIAEAEQRLKAVVQDHPTLSLGSREYRRALITLGDLYAQRGRDGDYRRAVDYYQMALDQDLREAEETGRSTRADVQLMYKIGDARRKAVLQLDDFLGRHAQPPKRRRVLEEIRTRHFQAARKMFDAVIRAYEKKTEPLTPREIQQYRSSYFYRADSAYELKKFEGEGGAIELYQSAAVKFANHPMALIAEIQLYNIHTELKQTQKAKAAVQRAKAKLKAVRKQAFERSTQVMSRQYWQRWLNWSAEHLDEPRSMNNVAKTTDL